jgi:hypothetical protein
MLANQRGVADTAAQQQRRSNPWVKLWTPTDLRIILGSILIVLVKSVAIHVGSSKHVLELDVKKEREQSEER